MRFVNGPLINRTPLLHQKQPVPAIWGDYTHKAPIQEPWKLAQCSNQTGPGFSMVLHLHLLSWQELLYQPLETYKTEEVAFAGRDVQTNTRSQSLFFFGEPVSPCGSGQPQVYHVASTCLSSLDHKPALVLGVWIRVVAVAVARTRGRGVALASTPPLRENECMSWLVRCGRKLNAFLIAIIAANWTLERACLTRRISWMRLREDAPLQFPLLCPVCMR